MAEDAKAVAEDDERIMPLTGHLDELRRRLIRVLVGLGLSFGACFLLHEAILRIVTGPAGRQAFVITHPSEAFMTSLRLSFFAALLVTAPLLLVEGWGFVRPGLHPGERKLLGWVTPVSLLLFGVGALGTLRGMPQLLGLLGRCAPTWVRPMLSIGRYATFTLKAMLLAGAVAQVPLLLALAWRGGFVRSAVFRRRRPAAWVAMGVFAALVAPADLLSKVAVALPLLALYEAAALGLRWLGR